MLLRKVISGGQVGTDLAGLWAAKQCGLETGGYMPKGFRTKIGPLSPMLVAHFGLVETSSERYPLRTEMNVRESDGTITLAYNYSSPGERLTRRLIVKHEKPSFGIYLEKIDGEWQVRPYGATYIGSTPKPRMRGQIYKLAERSYAQHVAAWIRQQEIEVLNVAGNGDTTIEPLVSRFLGLVFSYLATEVNS